MLLLSDFLELLLARNRVAINELDTLIFDRLLWLCRFVVQWSSKIIYEGIRLLLFLRGWGEVCRWLILWDGRRTIKQAIVSLIIKWTAIIHEFGFGFLLFLFCLVVQGTTIINEFLLNHHGGRRLNPHLSLLRGSENVGKDQHQESQSDSDGTPLQKWKVISLKAWLIARHALSMEAASAVPTLHVEVTVVLLHKTVNGLQCEAVVMNRCASLVQAARRLTITMDVAIGAGFQ